MARFGRDRQTQNRQLLPGVERSQYGRRGNRKQPRDPKTAGCSVL